uniref:Uncharacterized protein n=1 Tax=Geospiza parvula TaxID=87175 RepID=A0A8C3NLD2_GEOPR
TSNFLRPFIWKYQGNYLFPIHHGGLDRIFLSKDASVNVSSVNTSSGTRNHFISTYISFAWEELLPLMRQEQPWIPSGFLQDSFRILWHCRSWSARPNFLLLLQGSPRTGNLLSLSNYWVLRQLLDVIAEM